MKDDGLGACRGIMCALFITASASIGALSLVLAYLARR